MSEHDTLLKTNYKLGKIVGRKVEATDMLLGITPNFKTVQISTIKLVQSQFFYS